MAASTSSSGSGVPRAASSAQRRRARSATEAVRNTLSSASGQTVVPTSRPSQTHDPVPNTSRCTAVIAARTPGWAATVETLAVTSGLRICSVTSVPSTAMAIPPGIGRIASRWPACDRGQPLAVGGLDAAAGRQVRHRAVHRAGVEIAHPQALGDLAGDRALAGAGRTVDGDDHTPAPSALRSAAKPGYETAAASKPATLTPSRLASPATAPSMAKR